MEVMAMSNSASATKKVVDVHCHVGLLGDEKPHWSGMSEWYTRQTVYKPC
jgi:hypothetical protein